MKSNQIRIVPKLEISWFFTKSTFSWNFYLSFLYKRVNTLLSSEATMVVMRVQLTLILFLFYFDLDVKHYSVAVVLLRSIISVWFSFQWFTSTSLFFFGLILSDILHDDILNLRLKQGLGPRTCGKTNSEFNRWCRF